MNPLPSSRLTLITSGSLHWLLSMLHDIKPAVTDVTAIVTLLLAIRHCYLAYRTKRSPRRLKSRLPLLAVLTLIVIFHSGCTIIRSTTYDPQSGYPSTRMSAVTVLDSSSALSKFVNRSAGVSSNQWAPGTSIGAYQAQSSAGTNLFQDIGIAIGTAIKTAH